MDDSDSWVWECQINSETGYNGVEINTETTEGRMIRLTCSLL